MNRLTNLLGLNLKGPIVASAAEDPTVAQTNDGPLLVVSLVPDSVPQNNSGPSTVLGKRSRGRTPKLNRGAKVWEGWRCMLITRVQEVGPSRFLPIL